MPRASAKRQIACAHHHSGPSPVRFFTTVDKKKTASRETVFQRIGLGEEMNSHLVRRLHTECQDVLNYLLEFSAEEAGEERT